MLLLYYFFKGVFLHFHVSIIPKFLLVFFFIFFPQTFVMSNRNPVIFVFLFLVVKPDCKFFWRFFFQLKDFILSLVCYLFMH